MTRTPYRGSIWALCLLALASIPPAAGAPSAGAQTGGGENVDIALVLVTDVSYSVDENEARFQREGAITAFRS